MTINSATRKAGPFPGDGVTTVFPFTFKVFTKNDVQVTLTSSSGAETQLVLDSNYTVSVNSDQTVSPGGTVTYPATLAQGYKLTITGALQNLQPTSLPNNGPWYPKTVEDAFDRSIILIQQLREQVDRAIKINVSDAPLPPLPSAASRANGIVGFDALGGSVVYPIPASVGAGDMKTDIFTAGVDFTAGATTALNLSRAPGNPANLEIFFDAAFQGPDQWSVAGTVVTFSSPIPAGVGKVFARIGTTLSTQIPPAGSVGDTQLVWASILNRAVDNLDGLRTLDKTKYARAFGAFPSVGAWYDPADSTSADNGITTFVAPDNGRWKVLSGGRIRASWSSVALPSALSSFVPAGGALEFDAARTLPATLTSNAESNLLGRGVSAIVDGGINTAIAVTPPADGNARENFVMRDLYVFNASGTLPTITFNLGAGKSMSRAAIEHCLFRNTGGGYAFSMSNGVGGFGTMDVLALSRFRDVAFNGGASFVGVGDSVRLESPNFTGANGLYVDQIVEDGTGRGDSSLFIVDDANSTADRGLLFYHATRPRVQNCNLECPNGIGASSYQALIAFDGGTGANLRRILDPVVKDNYIASSATCPNGVYLLNTDQAVISGNVFGMGPTGNAIVVTGNAKNTRIIGNIFVPSGTGREILDNGVGTMGIEKNIPLQNGWVAYGAGRKDPIFYKDPSTQFVTLSGTCKLGMTGDNTAIATLPPGFIPYATEEFVVRGFGPSSSYTASMIVSTTGEILITGVPTGGNVSLSFCGIRFYAPLAA